MTALVRSLSTATSPSSGSSAIVWPFFTFLPPIRASRTASVTWTVASPRPAVVMGPAFAADLRRLLGRQPDVRVVGQQQHLARPGKSSNSEELARARVGGLAAAHDLGDAEVAEQLL